MFSLSWFTTIPGLLITAGVLLLIIALIVFIVTSRKEKKGNVDNSSNNAAAVSPNAIPAVSPIAPSPVPQPTMPIEQSVPTMPGVATMPAQSAFPNVGTNTLDNVSNSNTTGFTSVAPAINPSDVYTQTEAPVMPSMPTADVAVTPVEQEMPSIYSGGDNGVQAVYTPEVSPSFPEMPSVSEPQIQISEPVVNESFVATPSVSTAPAEYSPVLNDNVMPVTNGVDTTAVPSVEQVVPEMQDISPVQVSEGTPNVSNMPVGMESVNAVDNSAPTVSDVVAPVETFESAPVQEAAPIYGGASPIVNDIQPEPVETHQIYGGANPLENTQSVSISDIANAINQPAPVEVSATPAIEMPTASSVSEVEPVQVSSDVVASPQVQASTVSPDYSAQAQPVQTPIPEYSVQQVQPVMSVGDYSAQPAQPAVSTEPQAVPMGINNNFAYQTAPTPQVVMPTSNMQ